MPPRRPVNLRSVALGLAAVVFVCSLAAYNDFALNNTNFVGSFLPLGLMLVGGPFVLLVNGPLWRWRPRWAFGRGELAVSLGMGLVGCGVASAGLMKYLPVLTVSPSYQAGEGPGYRAVMDELHLPTWVMPRLSPAADTAARRAADPVVTGLFGRDPRGVPWAAWLPPAVGWGVFLLATFGSVLSLLAILRRQWVEHERLPFPIATLYLSLIDPPPPGRLLNGLLSAKSFWVAAGVVFAVHSVSALAKYDARHWPAIPLRYDLTNVLADGPGQYLEASVKSATVYFTLVGLTHFMRQTVAFSLWWTYLAMNVAEVVATDTTGRTFTYAMRADELTGAFVPVALAAVWVARGHLAMVARRMVGRRRATDPTDPFVSYPLAGWAAVACGGVMAGWLAVVGCTAAGAVALSIGLLAVLIVLAKVVAETGLAWVLMSVPLARPWAYLLADVPRAMAVRTTTRTVFLTGLIDACLSRDGRESAAVFAGHAIRVADGPAPGRADADRPGRGLIPALLLAAVVAYAVAGAAYLSVDYRYSVTLDATHQTPINAKPWAYAAQTWVLDPAVAYAAPGGPRDGHSRLGHFGFGFAVTALLSVLRLRYAAWPLHPVGFLLVTSWTTSQVWFSLMLGWTANLLLLRIGGAKLYRAARPAFVGLIAGETAAAAVWLAVTVVLHATGHEYHAIQLLPH